jgi:hypothetical protein
MGLKLLAASVQNLLDERFHMTAHVETRPRLEYALPARGKSPANFERQAEPPVPPRRINGLQHRWDRHSACRDFCHRLLVVGKGGPKLKPAEENPVWVTGDDHIQSMNTTAKSELT